MDKPRESYINTTLISYININGDVSHISCIGGVSIDSNTTGLSGVIKTLRKRGYYKVANKTSDSYIWINPGYVTSLHVFEDITKIMFMDGEYLDVTEYQMDEFKKILKSGGFLVSIN